MFALVPLAADPASINLKCEPELALALRAQNPAVRPGYHQNKRHWNTVELDGTIPGPALPRDDHGLLRTRPQPTTPNTTGPRARPVIAPATHRSSSATEPTEARHDTTITGLLPCHRT
jgi:YjbR protein